MTAKKESYVLHVRVPTALWHLLLEASGRVFPDLDVDRERRLARGLWRTGCLSDDGYRVRAFVNSVATEENLLHHFSEVRYPQPVGAIPKRSKWVLVPMSALIVNASAAACRRLRKLAGRPVPLNGFRCDALVEFLDGCVHKGPPEQAGPAVPPSQVEQVMAALNAKPGLRDGVRRCMAAGHAKGVAALLVSLGGEVRVRFTNGDVVVPDSRVGAILRDLLTGAVPIIEVPPGEPLAAGVPGCAR